MLDSHNHDTQPRIDALSGHISEAAMRHALQHAWSWLSAHLQQRAQNIYYFLSATSFLTGAYVTAVTNHLWWLAVAMGLLGFIIACTFIVLQHGNNQCIQAGEQAMQRAEIVLSNTIKADIFDILRSMEARTPRMQRRYIWAFRGLFGGIALAFFASAALALWQV